jgi:excisionase family DNA binding protein
MLSTTNYNQFTHQEWFSIEETAEFFQLSVRTIMKLLKDRELYSVKWGKERKVRVSSVFRYLTKKGIIHPSELSKEFREIILAEKSMYEAKKSLEFAFDEVMKKKAEEMYRDGYFDSEEYKKSSAPVV